MGWERLNAEAIRAAVGSHIMVANSHGRGYFGKIENVHAHCVVLSNFDFSQNVFFDRGWQFQFVTLPTIHIPRMAERRLPLENRNG